MSSDLRHAHFQLSYYIIAFFVGQLLLTLLLVRCCCYGVNRQEVLRMIDAQREKLTVRIQQQQLLRPELRDAGTDTEVYKRRKFRGEKYLSSGPAQRLGQQQSA